ncbi:hypothetical protein H6F39_08470 [Anabaena sp. FACHB-1250]|uniref:Uncharacterized protein n=2 Tax=Dolichospermum TaxID=748770 RepID=A0A480ACQ0_9CYAN|nr:MULTISPECIES: hypothetical protein [Nostocales]MBD2141401.1 hypothetical protein [Anabaena sp. FACHB-1250]MBD2270433.1 hypothetical protein [Anabaena sp. FACHB-1391]MBE9219714.1 hypothetical protein [Dolichospermum flos-aquae LEGE 04289]GCL42890.1 hypothetical protein NIES80_25990 [Dolichospermum planctonicum]
MQAYKLKGKIDQSGNLLITELVNLPPGNVEVIVWPATDTHDHTTTSEPAPETPKRRTKIKALQNWFEKTQPAPPDFDPDQAKWEHLKEKHNL